MSRTQSAKKISIQPDQKAMQKTRDLQNKEDVLDAVAEKVRTIQRSPTRKNK